MIIWLDSLKKRIATNSIRGYNLSSKRTIAISGNSIGSSSDHFSQSQTDDTDLFTVDQQSVDIGICRVVAQTGNDLYHNKWVMILLCCGDKAKADGLSKIFQTRRVVIPNICVSNIVCIFNEEYIVGSVYKLSCE